MDNLLCLENLACAQVLPEVSLAKRCPKETMRLLLRDESRYCVVYLAPNDVISPAKQEMLAQWMCQVCVLREEDVFSMAINICSRFMNRYYSQITTEHLLQLIGASSIHVASKLLESDPLTGKQVAYFTDDAYTADDILSMDLVVLSVLHFDIFSVPPGHFLDALIRFLDIPAEQQEVTKKDSLRRITLSLIDPELLCCRSSVLAASCLISSLQNLGFPLGKESVQNLVEFIGTDQAEISRVCELSIASVAKNWSEIYEAESGSANTVDAVELKRQDSAGYGTMDEDELGESDAESEAGNGNEVEDFDEDEAMEQEVSDDEGCEDAGDEAVSESGSEACYLIDSDSGIQDDVHVVPAPYSVSVTDYFTDDTD